MRTVREVPALETDRLRLRGWQDADRAPFAALNADPEVMEHFPSTLDRAESDAMVDRIVSAWEERGFCWWAVDVSASGRFVGFVGLSSPSWHLPSGPCVEIGWRLARAAWGQGYASEAARAALAFGFSRLSLPDDEIVSFTTTANVRSRRVMERIGLSHHPSRDFDHPLLPHWSGRRHVLYAISRSAWERRPQG